jgi:hypothetical protein
MHKFWVTVPRGRKKAIFMWTNSDPSKLSYKQDESYKYERMSSQENGRRSGSKSCSIEGVGVDVDNGDYQRTITIRSLKTWSNGPIKTFLKVLNWTVRVNH